MLESESIKYVDRSYSEGALTHRRYSAMLEKAIFTYLLSIMFKTITIITTQIYRLLVNNIASSGFILACGDGVS